MAERIKLNKVCLREQKQELAMYERFLPALEARKQQFLMQLAIVRGIIEERESAVSQLVEEIASWSPLFWDLQHILPYFVAVREVRHTIRNVAGLKVPGFREVVFHDAPYSLFATPYSFDAVLSATKQAISLREQIRMLREEERILSEGLRKTSQRINLYEQRLIPQCKEAIRKITVYLQDRQAAAVGVAKVAKGLGGEALY